MSWWRRRWVRQLASYVLVVSGFAGILWQLDEQAEVQCADRRAGRDALRGVIIESFRPGVPLDAETLVTALPSYDEVEDPATQRLIIELLNTLANRGGSREELRDTLLESVPPIECG